MAFKILSFDELELLTENQRESYEEELAIYNERVKFVEQMERFENTVIKPYKSKLAAIPAVCEVPEKEFVEPEYKIAKIAPFTKPEHKVAAIRFGEPVTAVVPGYAKIKNIPVGHMKNVEQNKPVLPIIFKAAAPANSFEKAEQQQPILPESVKISIPGNTFKKSEQVNPNLPIAVKPQNFEDLFFMPVTIASSVKPENSAELAVPAIEVPDFAAPEYVLPTLPKPEVEFSEVGVMELPELATPVLPEMIVTKQMDVSWKQTGEIKAELPEIFDTPIVKTLFGEPDIQKTKLPTVQKSEIPTREFTTLEHTVSDFPMVGISKESVPVFTAPKLEKPTIQTVMKPSVSPRSLFTAPEFEKPTVQTVVKPVESPSLLFAVPKLEKPTVQTVVKPVESPSLLFTAPEFEKPTVQTVVKPVESPSFLFAAPELEKPTVQTVVKPAASPSLLFAVPELEKPTVQTVVKTAASPRLTFTVPELEEPTVHTVVKSAEIPKIYDGKMSVNNTPKIEYPSINVFSVKPFEKVHSKVSGLPTIYAAASPDDCTEELLKIRLSIQKEYETRKEGFA